MGTVVTWGNQRAGGDSGNVAEQLSSGVVFVVGSQLAFAAVETGGRIVTWGSEAFGGDASSVAEQVASGVTFVASTEGFFAALRVVEPSFRMPPPASPPPLCPINSHRRVRPKRKK